MDVAGYDGLGVKNATVSLQETGFSVTTDNDGNFTLVNVPLGDYQLNISAPDMDTVSQSVSLSGQTLEVTIPPMVVNQSDYVQGDANGDAQIGLDDAIYIFQVLTGMR